MKKLNKIFSIVLTAAIMTSLLITSAIPVAAGTNEWSTVTIPGATGLVVSNEIESTGLLTQASDGTLFASLGIDGEYFLGKSTNGGRTWTTVKTPSFTGLNTGVTFDAGEWEIQAIATSPTDAAVVYIASLHTVFKSTDGGATFTKMASVPANGWGDSYDIVAMDVAMAGGTYKVVVGANYTGWPDSEVFYMDESDFFFNFQTIGTPSFGTQHDADQIYDVVLSPNFATDKGIVVLAEGDDNRPLISFNVNGGAWGSAVDAVEETDIDGSFWGGQIALPADFNIVSSPFFYVGIDGTGSTSGVYRVVGSPTTSSVLRLPAAISQMDVFSIDVVGNFASASIIIGSDEGEVAISTNAGASWTEGSDQLTGPGNEVYVCLADDFVTSGIACAMVAASGSINDESAFNLTVDKGVNWNQVSLVNTDITSIEAMEVGGGFTWLSTQNDYNGVVGQTAGTFTVTVPTLGTAVTTAADSVTLVNTGSVSLTAELNTWVTGDVDDISVAFSAAGSYNIVAGTMFITLPNGGDSVTISALLAGIGFDMDVTGGGTYSFIENFDGSGDNISITGTPPNYTVVLPDIAVVSNVNTVVTVDVTGGTISVSGPHWSGGSGDGTMTFDVNGESYTVTATGSTTVTGTVVTTSGTAPVYAGANPPVAGAFTLAYPITPVTANVTNSIWRMSGGNWERVLFTEDDAAIDLLTLSEDGAALFMGTFGDVNSLEKSMDNGENFDGTIFSDPPSLNTFIAVNAQTFIVGDNNGVVHRSADNGFIWTATTIKSGDSTPATAGDITAMATNGTAVVVGTDDGRFAFSADMGATWGAATKTADAATGEINAVALQMGSNTAAWGVTDDGKLVKSSKPSTDLDEGLLTNGVGVFSGAAPSDSYAVYALDANGEVIRLLSNGQATSIGDFTSGTALFGAGNTLTALVNGNAIRSYTDTLAVAVTGVTATANSTSSITINWAALADAEEYAVNVKTGSAEKNYFSATFAFGDATVDATTLTVTGLAADTTYYVSVWGVDPVDTFYGTTSVATKPDAVTTPVSLAPVAGAIGVPVNPSFQWGGVAGATSYTVEVATDALFTNIVKTLTTPIAAVAWDGASLANNTVYYWRVTATTATGTSAAVESVFTTVTAATPPVTVTSTTSPNITLTQLPAPDVATPGYIWIIIAIGGILTVLVIVLIVRTRRVV
ncbi:MAG: fibronectin type III domain-containing protein [Dehalogenimonas sp.]|uniref:Fibronectin type III domain-containing protein n=1 Tax=Candidatus Dehalogenimonas loeffleri TaxID=3127115 RepID=A0ABZ2J9Z9_9CHLR|nr:fibronectin type III domain-containing protein [Dehalogenimonas sp.]